MNNFPQLLKVAIRYGALASVLGVGLIIALFYMDRHPFLVPVFFDFRILLFAVFIFFALREYRELSNGGVLFFWQGMIGAFLLVLSYSIIVTTFILVFGSFEPAFVRDYITQFTEQARTFPPEVIEEIGRDEFEKSLQQLQSATIRDLGLSYFVQSGIIGFFVGIILSVILRRQPKP